MDRSEKIKEYQCYLILRCLVEENGNDFDILFLDEKNVDFNES